MGYQAVVSGPERPALISLRTNTAGLPAVERALGLTAPRPAGLTWNKTAVPHPFTGWPRTRPRQRSPLASESASVTMFGLGPDEWLIRTKLDEEEYWFAKLVEATAATFSAVVLVSDAWRVFTIAGPETLEVLAQSTGADVHPSACPTGRALRTAFAGTSALIHRIDDRPAFDVYVDAALARYAGRWIESATGAVVRTGSLA